jgi:hypothetical protein
MDLPEGEGEIFTPVGAEGVKVSVRGVSKAESGEDPWEVSFSGSKRCPLGSKISTVTRCRA